MCWPPRQKALHPSTAFLCSIGRASLAWLFYEYNCCEACLLFLQTPCACIPSAWFPWHGDSFRHCRCWEACLLLLQTACACTRVVVAACCAGSYKCLGTVLVRACLSFGVWVQGLGFKARDFMCFGFGFVSVSWVWMGSEV